jgi:hypothetical protein
MSSLKMLSGKEGGADMSLKRILKKWSLKQAPPRDARARLLQMATLEAEEYQKDSGMDFAYHPLSGGEQKIFMLFDGRTARIWAYSFSLNLTNRVCY